MTMLNREAVSVSADQVLSKIEMTTLSPDKKGNQKKVLKEFKLRLAKLGGYLARASDGPQETK